MSDLPNVGQNASRPRQRYFEVRAFVQANSISDAANRLISAYELSAEIAVWDCDDYTMAVLADKPIGYWPLRWPFGCRNVVSG